MPSRGKKVATFVWDQVTTPIKRFPRVPHDDDPPARWVRYLGSLRRTQWHGGTQTRAMLQSPLEWKQQTLHTLSLPSLFITPRHHNGDKTKTEKATWSRRRRRSSREKSPGDHSHCHPPPAVRTPLGPAPYIDFPSPCPLTPLPRPRLWIHYLLLKAFKSTHNFWSLVLDDPTVRHRGTPVFRPVFWFSFLRSFLRDNTIVFLALSFLWRHVDGGKRR